MLGVFAEFETNLRRERQLEGIAKAKAAGVYKGHPSAFFSVPSCGLTEWPSVRVASLRRFRPTSAGSGQPQPAEATRSPLRAVSVGLWRAGPLLSSRRPAPAWRKGVASLVRLAPQQAPPPVSEPGHAHRF